MLGSGVVRGTRVSERGQRAMGAVCVDEGNQKTPEEK